MRHQAILEALEDERVNDEASFKAAILARQRRAEAEQHQHQHQQTVAATAALSLSNGPAPASAPKRWAVVEGREYPILTERAEAVARWIREAPTSSSSGGADGKRKKKTKKSANAHPAPAPASASSVNAGVDAPVSASPPVPESSFESAA